jgi:heme/copper-type cytochrome/quinol oxidase subunit 1
VIRPGPAEVAPCRSRALAAWLAVIGGVLGAHRFYLHGRRDRVGWLAWPPTVAGLVGLWRLRTVGADDGLALLLLPLLGLSIAAAMAAAIVIALTSDEQWATRFGGPVRPSGWIPVLAAIVALLLGATALLSALAISFQRFFEWQLGPADVASATVRGDDAHWSQVSNHSPM